MIHLDKTEYKYQIKYVNSVSVIGINAEILKDFGVGIYTGAKYRKIPNAQLCLLPVLHEK